MPRSVECGFDRVADGGLPVRQGEPGVEPRELQPVAQPACQVGMSPGEIEQREMRKLDQMADMGVAVVGEREGQFAQLRLAGAEGEEVVVEQTPRIVVQPAVPNVSLSAEIGMRFPIYCVLALKSHNILCMSRLGGMHKLCIAARRCGKPAG